MNGYLKMSKKSKPTTNSTPVVNASFKNGVLRRLGNTNYFRELLQYEIEKEMSVQNQLNKLKQPTATDEWAEKWACKHEIRKQTKH